MTCMYHFYIQQEHIEPQFELCIKYVIICTTTNKTRSDQSMTNLQRLNLEVQGIELTPEEATVYLAENGLVATEEYNPSSNTNKRAILSTALSILESLANNPTLMRQMKADDITISDFSDNLMNRIDQLTRTIRQMSVSDNNDSNLFMLFSR